MNNIFALQDSISGNVAEALKAALLGKEAVGPEQKTDPEAYNNYLLGKHFSELPGKENQEKAEGYYKKALSIDSTYAPAWVGLSVVHWNLAESLSIPRKEGFAKARREAEKALELDPNLVDAYAAIGWMKMANDWDWKGADVTFKKGLEIEPENPLILSSAAVLAGTLGRIDETIRLGLRLIEIDPAKAGPYFRLGVYYAYAGLPDESIAVIRKCLELNPEYPQSHGVISCDYLEMGKLDSALIEIKKEKSIQSYWLAIVYFALGKKKEADDKLQEFVKRFQDGGAFQIAEIYAFRGEKDKAFEWLERAYRHRSPDLNQITGDPLMRNIVKDPRYAAFMKKMKLPIKG